MGPDPVQPMGSTSDYGKSVALLEEAATHEQQAFYCLLYLPCQELVLRITHPTITGLYTYVRCKVLVLVRGVRDRRRKAQETVIEELEALDPVDEQEVQL